MSLFSKSRKLHGLVVAVATITVAAPPIAPAFAQAPPPTPGPAAPAPSFTRQKLEQLAAPVALYPDGLLTQVFMASTYPLDVVQAARWRRAHPSLNGATLERALQSVNWDPSVKAVVAFPDVIRMMDEKIDWTEQLGEAFLAQEDDLLQAVQDLRTRADQAGNLKSTPQRRVTRSGSYYVIEPVDPDVIYVPYYEPAVYGAWLYSDYPPFYWYPSSRPIGLFWFGTAIAGGAALWATWDWNRRRIAINDRRYMQYNRTRTPITEWRHDPTHRRGAPYRSPVLANKFQNAQPLRRGPAGGPPLSKGGMPSGPANKAGPAIITPPSKGPIVPKAMPAAKSPSRAIHTSRPPARVKSAPPPRAMRAPSRQAVRAAPRISAARPANRAPAARAVHRRR